MNKHTLADVEQMLRQGRLQEARELCLKLCKRDRGTARAWSLLGVINGQLGMFGDAEKCFRKVIDLDPEAAEAYFNLAKAQSALGQRRKAEQNYRRAVRINPSFAQAYNNLGTLQAGLNKPREAERNLRRAIEIQPDNPNPYRNLAILMRQQRRLDEAESCYRAALQLRPGFGAASEELAALLTGAQRYAEAEEVLVRAVRCGPADGNVLLKLGTLYFLRGEYDKAEECYLRVLDQAPDHVEALIDLGAVREKRGEPRVSLEYYRKALALAPDNIRAHNNASVAYYLMGAYQESADAARKALAINPDSAQTCHNLANALNRLGRLEEAAGALERGLRLQPDDAKAYANLGQILLLQGKAEEARACARRAVELRPDLSDAHSAMLYAMNIDPRYSREELFRAHGDWAARHEQPVVAVTRRDSVRDPERRLRIGYVSPDFRAHSVSFFFEPILRHHDREAFEVYCYANVANPDRTTARLQSLSDHWRHCRGVSDADLARSVADDGIDILVDLAGHTADGRLPAFARQPAPIQASYLGYPNTTGMRRIQYLITDRHCDPEPDADAFYSETLLRLPGAFFCYQPPEEAPDVGASPALEHGYVTFASFNNLAKISPQVIGLWAEVLKAVPDARLEFQCRSFDDPPTRSRYEALFAARGVDPGRIRFTAGQDFNTYLAGHARVDIVLDAFPWNGHTVTCHALWMGVPVITRAGDRHASRMGASILTTLGLDECIGGSDAEFIAAAAGLARDPGRLNDLRQRLRPLMRSSGLCDGRTFTRQLEAQYRQVWRQWCAGTA